MNIYDMHILFRQYGQQMGMQLVRTILPEQIDLCLNSAIVNFTNNAVETYNAKNKNISKIRKSELYSLNSIRTLYKTYTIPCYNIIDNNSGGVYFGVPSNSEKYGVFKQTPYTSSTGITPPNVFNFIDFNIEYFINCSWTVKLQSLTEHIYVPPYLDNVTYFEKQRSNVYNIRLIDKSLLTETLHDYILKPTYNSPIIVINKNDDYNFFDSNLELYIENFENGHFKNGNCPANVYMNYIARPAIVSFDNDVNCDLPEFIHDDIVKLAVDIWIKSVTNQTQMTK